MAIDLTQFFITDEDGNQVELTRPETKSWSDVVQCINHHKGQNDKVVRRFIELYLLGIQWDWFESYKDWLSTFTRMKEYNDALVPDTETGELPPSYPLPDMPERPLSDTVDAVMRLQYQVLRKAAYGDTSSQFDEVFDTEDHGVNNRAKVKGQYPK
ncbi:hypothetical protein [Endozoicomonas acroporae]|uniref:hypothetical protein n=1 Tax=Endozoicomonas acroporae TaxID=1701104 RepID=UPI0013D2EF11|nr:hypothetical protein [Endozoicomonas acroporae]